MTDYQAIIDYVKKNNITNYIIVTDDDIESFGENIPGAKIIRSDIEERNRLSKKPATRKPETFDQRISRIKQQFELYKKLNVNANDFKPGVNSEGKEQVLKALPSNYAKTFKNYDLYLTDDFNVVGYLVPDKKKIVVNGNLSIQDVVEVVKHELDHVMGLKESYDEAQYEYQIFVNNEVLDDYFEDEDSAYAKAEELKQSKYYNGEEIYKIELWRAPLGELDGELYDMILDESYDNVKLNQIKESYKVEDNGGGYIYIYDTDNDNIESGVDFDEINPLDLISALDVEVLINDKAPWTKKLSILKAAARETKAAYRSFGYGSKHNIKFNNVPENILKEWVDKCVKYFKEMYPEIVKSLTENSLIDDKASQLKSLKESLSPVKFNKIQKLMYFAGKIGKTPEEAFSNGTYY